MLYPKIYLAIDNCFASKRWNIPSQWFEIIKNIGIDYVELSADNDCDPLFMGDDYLKIWFGEVNENCVKYNMKISSMYSGHGTYTMLGLGHHNDSVRSVMRDRWLKPMINNAAALGAGLGFYCHAFSQQDLQNKNAYDDACRTLYNELELLTQYASDKKLRFMALEQMYTPHQIPWTIKSCTEILKSYKNDFPLYITLDTGHQSLQSQFQMPNENELLYNVENIKHLWLGSQNANNIFYSNKASSKKVAEITKDMRKHPWLFASPEDTDHITWFERLARYSPIIHLQQCGKNNSPHWPFTNKYNTLGIIKPNEILSAIKRCYDISAENGMPPSVDEIYLTLEIFSPTMATPYDIIKNITDSAEYWRKFIPEDGRRIDELIYGIFNNQTIF